MPAATVAVLRLIRQRHEAMGVLLGKMIKLRQIISMRTVLVLDEMKPVFRQPFPSTLKYTNHANQSAAGATYL